MNLVLREPTRDDAAELGRIVFDAFGAIAEQHRFPPDFSSREMASGLIGQLLDHPGFYGIAAELDGRVVGSNFLDERSHIIGLGPITVDPAVQNQTIGRRLMECMLTRVRDDDRPGVRRSPFGRARAPARRVHHTRQGRRLSPDARHSRGP